MLRGLTVSATAAVALSLAAAATADTPDAVRDEFRSAYFAAATGARLDADDDGAALRDYILYPYLVAARISKALTLVAGPPGRRDREAAAFVTAHRGEPVADGVRRARLESLARRGLDAALIDLFEPGLAGADVECAWLAARLDAGDIEGLAGDVLDRWLTPRRLPLACEPVFEWLRGQDVLDDAATAERVRLLLANGETGFARVIAANLPDAAAAPLLLHADLIDAPGPTLDRLIAAGSRNVDDAVLLDAYSRLARDAPDAAIERLPEIVAALSIGTGTASRLTRALAYGLAWDRDPRALDYFERIAPQDIDDYTLEWHARAALWNGRWRQVEAVISAMSAEMRATSAWRYWAGRAAAELGDTERAHTHYDALAGDDNYYSAMAAARRGRRITPRQQTFATDDEMLERLRSRASFVRARELRAVELTGEALAEWRHAQTDLAPAERKQSVHLAMGWGWHDLAIATAATHAVYYDYRLLYPTPYAREVRAAARLTRLDAPLIHALIRQESLYRPDAVSAAGAVGLTQLRPATAAAAAERWGRPRPGRSELLTPAVNIELGAAELRTLVERFDAQLPVALAAYNAGPNAVRRWLPDTSRDADVWIENIPYNETRAYVRRVLWHSLVFKWLGDGEAQSAERWLGQVRAAQPDQAGTAPERRRQRDVAAVYAATRRRS